MWRPAGCWLAGAARVLLPMASLLCSSSAYKGFGSFHGESVEVLVRAASKACWTPPALPAAVASALRSTPRPAAGTFGSSLRTSQFLLDPTWAFVNHGAFGSPCNIALDSAAAWRQHAEAQPLRFIDRELFPQLVESTRRVSGWLGACPTTLALLPNATTGLNAVISSVVAQLSEGDEVLILDAGYGSVSTMLRRACAQSGAVLVSVPLLAALNQLCGAASTPPPTAEDVAATTLECVELAMTNRTRLAIFDDITSNTALKLPSSALATLCRDRGVLSLVDAAHSVCSPAGVPALTHADFVVGNLHKWACAPRGAAFLYARSEHQQRLEPPVLSHGYGQGFHSNFIWSGAADYSPLLALPALIDDFWGALGGVASGVEYQQRLLGEATQHLCEAWCTRTLVDVETSGVHMALVQLPTPPDGVTSKDVQDALYHSHQVECPVKTVGGKLYCRISAGLYNELEDYERLGEAVLELLPRK